MSWGRSEDRASRYLKELEVQDLSEQLDNLRSYVRDLTTSLGKTANRQWGRARHRALDAAEEAEEVMKDNLTASLLVTLAIGVFVGYMIRRGTE